MMKSVYALIVLSAFIALGRGVFDIKIDIFDKACVNIDEIVGDNDMVVLTRMIAAASRKGARMESKREFKVSKADVLRDYGITFVNRTASDSKDDKLKLGDQNAIVEFESCQTTEDVGGGIIQRENWNNTQRVNGMVTRRLEIMKSLVSDGSLVSIEHFSSERLILKKKATVPFVYKPQPKQKKSAE